jgi:hypothetical protein
MNKNELIQKAEELRILIGRNHKELNNSYLTSKIIYALDFFIEMLGEDYENE